MKQFHYKAYDEEGGIHSGGAFRVRWRIRSLCLPSRWCFFW